MEKNQQKQPLLFVFEEIMPRNTPVFPRVSKNEITPLHKHTYVEFFYTLEGVGTHILNGKKYPVRFGDACILTPNDIHGFEPVKGAETKHMDVCIEAGYFKSIFDYFSPTQSAAFFNGNAVTFKLSAEKLQKIDHYVPLLFLTPTEETYKTAAKILVSIFIELIIAHSAEKQPLMPDWLFKLLGDFNSRGNFQCPISDITGKYAYNANYMRRIFKEYTGITMTEYFNRQKMDYAYTLLTSTDKPVETICEIVGFNNISYFYHLFKEIYNATPNQIRNKQ